MTKEIIGTNSSTPFPLLIPRTIVNAVKCIVNIDSCYWQGNVKTKPYRQQLTNRLLFTIRILQHQAVMQPICETVLIKKLRILAHLVFACLYSLPYGLLTNCSFLETYKHQKNCVYYQVFTKHICCSSSQMNICNRYTLLSRCLWISKDGQQVCKPLGRDN